MLRFNFPSTAVEDMPFSCALDLAEKGGMTLEEVASRLNVVRERVRQVEERALRTLKRHDRSFSLKSLAEAPSSDPWGWNGASNEP